MFKNGSYFRVLKQEERERFSLHFISFSPSKSTECVSLNGVGVAQRGAELLLSRTIPTWWIVSRLLLGLSLWQKGILVPGVLPHLSVPEQKGISLFSNPLGPAGSVNGEISAFCKKFGSPSVAVNRKSDGRGTMRALLLEDMGAAVARRSRKASWVVLAGLQYFCLTCCESYDRATNRRASAKWFLTKLEKVGLPFSLCLYCCIFLTKVVLIPSVILPPFTSPLNQMGLGLVDTFSGNWPGLSVYSFHSLFPSRQLNFQSYFIYILSNIIS